MFGKIYLNVPYSQKEEAKGLGARWDFKLKKWYYNGKIKDFAKFGKWIVDENEPYGIIACETICIIEGRRKCYRCGKTTRIIGLGVCEHGYLGRDGDDFFINVPNFYSREDKWLRLAWVDDEKDIPPLLLSYIKNNYNVRIGHSSIVGKCFANHCDYCDSIQGNNYLFSEDSPISTMNPDNNVLLQRMKELKIYYVRLDEKISLNWNVHYCSADWAYREAGATWEKLILPGCSDEKVTYKELYQLK